MSFSVTPQCAVDEIHDSSDCSKWHFGRQEMSFFHRLFLYFDPVFWRQTGLIPIPYSRHIWRAVSTTVWINFVVVNCSKCKAKTTDSSTLIMGTKLTFGNIQCKSYRDRWRPTN